MPFPQTQTIPIQFSDAGQPPGLSGTGPPNGVAGDCAQGAPTGTTISGHCPYDWLITFYPAVP
jgi:hypothetical protein